MVKLHRPDLQSESKSRRKKGKKTKEKVEEQSKAVKDEDFADEELTPAQADPYLCEADLEVEGNEEVKMSKRCTELCTASTVEVEARSISPRPRRRALANVQSPELWGEKNTLLFVVVHSCLLLFLLCTAQSGKCFLKLKPFTLQECFFSSPGCLELALLRKVALPCRLRSAATMAGRLRGRSDRQSLRTHLG